MYLFQRINKAASKFDFKSVQEAREWYRNTAASIDKVNRNRVFSSTSSSNVETTITIGKMFMFRYDAKHKDKLPFFDMYPLVFPIDFYNDGFLGINLHYLPMGARANLMDALYGLINNQKYDDSTKLLLSYKILKGSSVSFSRFDECVKRYLYGHVKSRFYYVDPLDWDKALMLPLQKWHVNSKYKNVKLPY